jgi:hypothetical protein
MDGYYGFLPWRNVYKSSLLPTLCKQLGKLAVALRTLDPTR